MHLFKELRSKDNQYAFSFEEAGKYVEVTQFTVNELTPMYRVVIPFTFAVAMYHGLLHDGYTKLEY